MSIANICIYASIDLLIYSILVNQYFCGSINICITLNETVIIIRCLHCIFNKQAFSVEADRRPNLMFRRERKKNSWLCCYHPPSRRHGSSLAHAPAHTHSRTRMHSKHTYTRTCTHMHGTSLSATWCEAERIFQKHNECFPASRTKPKIMLRRS